MKILRTTCLGLAMLMAVTARPAAGQTDEIGIFLDPDATLVEGFLTPAVPFDLYFCLTNPSSPNVFGFEFGYAVDEWGEGGHLTRLDVTLPVTSIDVGDSAELAAGDYVVGLAVPLPGTPSVVLVRWQMLMDTAILASLTLGPSRIPSLPSGVPVYDDGGTLLPMPVASTCWGQDFRLNHFCPLTAEPRTMGAVKALYR